MHKDHKSPCIYTQITYILPSILSFCFCKSALNARMKSTLFVGSLCPLLPPENVITKHRLYIKVIWYCKNFISYIIYRHVLETYTLCIVIINIVISNACVKSFRNHRCSCSCSRYRSRRGNLRRHSSCRCCISTLRKITSICLHHALSIYKNFWSYLIICIAAKIYKEHPCYSYLC